MRGATQTTQPKVQTTDISIHAPHAGSDFVVGPDAETTKAFQSTLPMRGATSLPVPGRPQKAISIHAPHAGSDSENYQQSMSLLIVFSKK